MKKVLSKNITRTQKVNVKTNSKNHLFQANSKSMIYLLILGITFIILYNYIYDNKIFLGGDNAVYYITGCALAEGQGYTNIHTPDMSPANHFPPGYPFIISIIVRLFGENMSIVRYANGVLLFTSIVMLFLIIKELTKNINLAFASSLIVLFNAHLLQFSTIEMSEIPFTFFSLLSVWCFIKTYNIGETLKQPYFWILVASIIVSFYIRSLGITLLGSTLIIFTLNKRWLQVIVLTLCFIIAYAPWYNRSEKLGGNVYSKQIQMINPYQPELGNMKISDYPKRFIENANRYLALEINSAFSGYYVLDYQSSSSWINYVLSILLLIITGIGIFTLKNFKWFIFILISGTLLILMFWPPVWTGIRFILPIIPLLLFLSITGVLFIIRKLSKRLSENKIYWNKAPLFCLFLIPYFSPNISQLNQNAKSNYPESFADYFELALWCNENLPENAIICTRKPELFYLYAHRKVNGYPFIDNTNDFFSYLKNEHITHVVADDLGFKSMNKYMVPAINNNLENFRKIKSQNKTNLWQVFYTDSIGYSGERDSIGRKEGKGKSHYFDGGIYEGLYHENRREGFGKFIFPTGNYYIGEFKNDTQDGTGTLYFKVGGYITGKWKKGGLNGFAIQYDEEGKIMKKGIWSGNKLIQAQ